jgi:hypothetical protein
MPTIARFLDIEIPKHQMMEIDGVPLTGKVSATDAMATLKDSIITVTWKAVDKKGKAKIWIATTNEFKNGKSDEYLMVMEVPVAKESASFTVKENSTGFFKIVIEMPHNFLNRWVQPSITEPK